MLSLGGNKQGSPSQFSSNEQWGARLSPPRWRHFTPFLAAVRRILTSETRTSSRLGVESIVTSVEAFAQHANATEVEKEVRAQIERALAFGVKPTHLDNYMGTILASPEYYQVLLKLGKGLTNYYKPSSIKSQVPNPNFQI